MTSPPPNKIAPEQKRAAVRLRLVNLPVELWCLTDRSSVRVLSEAINISEGGLAVEAPQGLPLGAKVQVRTQLPQAGPAVHCLAEVVRCEAQRRGSAMRLGLRFIGLPEPRRDQLVRWIFAVLASRRRT